MVAPFFKVLKLSTESYQIRKIGAAIFLTFNYRWDILQINTTKSEYKRRKKEEKNKKILCPLPFDICQIGTSNPLYSKS